MRALETLARLRLSDRESLETLARLFPVAESPGVQTAIAGVLIRADYRHDRRRPSSCKRCASIGSKSAGGGQDLIDVLIRRLQAQSGGCVRRGSNAPFSCDRPARSLPDFLRLLVRSLREARPPCILARRLFASCPTSMPVSARVALLAALLFVVAALRCAAPTGRPSARSPSTRPTRRKSFAATCPQERVSSSSSSSSAVVPIGSPRRAAPVSAATCSSSPATSTAARSSTRIDSTRASSCPSTRWSASSCSDSCPGLFSQLKEVYLFGCNTLNARGDAQRVRGDRAEPRPLGAFAGRRRALVARAERAARRKQSRSHAPHLQGRAGDLRLFVEGAARPHGGPDARALFSIDRERRDRKRPREREAAGSLRAELDDRRRRA